MMSKMKKKMNGAASKKEVKILSIWTSLISVTQYLQQLLNISRKI